MGWRTYLYAPLAEILLSSLGVGYTDQLLSPTLRTAQMPRPAPASCRIKNQSIAKMYPK